MAVRAYEHILVRGRTPPTNTLTKQRGLPTNGHHTTNSLGTGGLRLVNLLRRECSRHGDDAAGVALAHEAVLLKAVELRVHRRQRKGCTSPARDLKLLQRRDRANTDQATVADQCLDLFDEAVFEPNRVRGDFDGL